MARFCFCYIFETNFSGHKILGALPPNAPAYLQNSSNFLLSFINQIWCDHSFQLSQRSPISGGKFRFFPLHTLSARRYWILRELCKSCRCFFLHICIRANFHVTLLDFVAIDDGTQRDPTTDENGVPPLRHNSGNSSGSSGSTLFNSVPEPVTGKEQNAAETLVRYPPDVNSPRSSNSGYMTAVWPGGPSQKPTARRPVTVPLWPPSAASSNFSSSSVEAITGEPSSPSVHDVTNDIACNSGASPKSAIQRQVPAKDQMQPVSARNRLPPYPICMESWLVRPPVGVLHFRKNIFYESTWMNTFLLCWSSSFP